MRDEDQKGPRPIALVAAIALTCLILALGALIYVGESRRYRGTRAELNNVWYGEQNNVIEFAPDGTGVGYINDQSPQFFRWSETNGTLRIYHEPRNKSLRLIAHQFIAELQGKQAVLSEVYPIESLKSDTMTILDSTTGDRLQFRTTRPTPE